MTTDNNAGNSADVVNNGSTGENTIVLDSDILKRATLTLRAIRNPERKKILQVIGEKGSITVNEICRLLNMPQPVVSLNLSILRKARVVIDDRKGKNIYYTIDAVRLRQVMKAAKELSWEERDSKISVSNYNASGTPGTASGEGDE